MRSFARVRDKPFVFGKHERRVLFIQHMWENPTRCLERRPPFGAYQNAFATYQWDVVSLHPFARTMEGPGGDRAHVANFINLARGNSPNARFSLYETVAGKTGRWPQLISTRCGPHSTAAWMMQRSEPATITRR